MAAMNIASVVVGIGFAIVGWMVLSAIRAVFWPPKAVPMKYHPRNVGDITLEELSKCNGEDPFRPICFAVRGKIYDVTEGAAFYGPGGGYQLFAGREISRALGKMAIVEAECNDDLSDFTEKEHTTLQGWEDKFATKYKIVGQIVPSKQMTLKELAEYNGSDASKPIYLAVRGVIFNVTAGRDFYGVDGAYPFGGRECARALAKFSTDISDCVADLEGCALAEMDSLRDWEARFHSKYPVVGRVVS